MKFGPFGEKYHSEDQEMYGEEVCLEGTHWKQKMSTMSHRPPRILGNTEAGFMLNHLHAYSVGNVAGHAFECQDL